eukprot:398703_1
MSSTPSSAQTNTSEEDFDRMLDELENGPYDDDDEIKQTACTCVQATTILPNRISRETLKSDSCIIIVFGASGRLAQTKIYPVLYHLFCESRLPPNVYVIGYDLTAFTQYYFRQNISTKLGRDINGNESNFLRRCWYFRGTGYDNTESYKSFSGYIRNLADEQYEAKSNRICYLATPPALSIIICERIKLLFLMPNTNTNAHYLRVMIEQAFGKDLQSFNKLHNHIKQFLHEDQMYYMAHYLAHEMVQNIIVFRFGNVIWDAIWNRQYIQCIKICIKDTATLHDDNVIIRCMLQKHLFQVLCLIAMEPPCSLKSEDIRNERVKVLKCIKLMDEKRSVIGCYDEYTKDQITFVQTVLFVDNARCEHVPFICECGKGLDATYAEVRIQLNNDGLCLFPEYRSNEIVMRLHPNKAIWWKMNVKSKGFARFDEANPFELDVSYKERRGRFGPKPKLPCSYTRLISDALKGDQSLFVGVDELREAWRIVTPFLHKLESEHKDVVAYSRGSKGPPQADAMAKQYGLMDASEV